MNIQTVDLASVIVPEGRFREANPKKVEEIAESFLKFGQMVPIILDRENKLVDGLHRYSALRINGALQVTAVFRDELDELFLKEMELEVNIKRVEMTWQEKARAIATLHEMKTARDPNWTQGQTAELAKLPEGRGQADVSNAVKLTKMMELFPELAEAKTLNQAMSWATSKSKNVLRVAEVKDNKIDFGEIESKIIHGNSVQVIKSIPDESFNAIITDPPFGIDYDSWKAGTTGTITDYKDDAELYEYLLTMAPDMYRVLKKDAWCVWFFGISWYERCKEVFRAAGFIVDEIPIIWDRSEGRSFTTRPDRYFGRSYDVALHMFKGDPQIGPNFRSKSNIIKAKPVGNAEREALVERPVDLYTQIIERLTVPNEIVADFFVGSGSCPAACARLGRDYFGCEKDAERRAIAIQKIKANTPVK